MHIEFIMYIRILYDIQRIISSSVTFYVFISYIVDHPFVTISTKQNICNVQA